MLAIRDQRLRAAKMIIDRGQTIKTLRALLAEARGYINESDGATFATDLLGRIDAALAGEKP